MVPIAMRGGGLGEPCSASATGAFLRRPRRTRSATTRRSTRRPTPAPAPAAAAVEDAPEDEYHAEYRAKRINGKATHKSFETKDLSATLESLASKGKCAQHYPGETERALRFVRDSGKVLNFSGVWKDEEAALLRTMMKETRRVFSEAVAKAKARG